MISRKTVIGVAVGIGLAAAALPGTANAWFLPWFFGNTPTGNMTCMSGPGAAGCYDGGSGSWYTPGQVNWLMDNQGWFAGVVFQ